MIELLFQNGFAMVYNVDDWEILRKTHRIIGEFIGNTTFLPTLPLRLQPEEAYLLLKRKIATLIQYDNLQKQPDANDVKISENFNSELFENLKETYRNERKRQLDIYIDEIVAKKRIKGDERSKEEILNEELEKSVCITPENLLYPILLRQKDKGEGIPVDFEGVFQGINLKNCRIFEDLYDKGYFVTSGCKFGGDFLVYEGDPLIYHAVFVVRCLQTKNFSLNCTELVAFGRLANSVKKKAILAFYDESSDKVVYNTLSWVHV